jgi:hypothetical protein
LVQQKLGEYTLKGKKDERETHLSMVGADDIGNDVDYLAEDGANATALLVQQALRARALQRVVTQWWAFGLMMSLETPSKSE